MPKTNPDGKSLVIVESPAKARTINRYLGADFVVKASMGHVRDLPEKDFGIDVSEQFAPTYQLVPARRKVVDELRKLSQKSAEVYLATDRDREGEAIAWHLAEALNLPPNKTKRVIFNEITKRAIQQAFEHPHGIDFDRVYAQQARRILDRIVGYELSPLLWSKIAKGLSAGRVQSVAVRLIVERERDIRAFVPEESWKLATYLTADPAAAAGLQSAWKELLSSEPSQKDMQRWLAEHGALKAELTELDGQEWQADNVEAAQAIAAALGFEITRVAREPWQEYQHLGLEQVALIGEFDPNRAPQLNVGDLKTRRTTSKPPAPFTTASLQQAASSTLRYSASRTMRAAQSLYEGVDLNGEGAVGLITYMRTDSTNLADDAVRDVRGLIGEHYGDRYLPEKPNVYGKRQQRTQEAHEAIRPTDARRTPESVRTALSDEQYKLYDLIWKRFVACQMPPAEWDSTTVHVDCDTSVGRARFTGTGRKLVFDGYMRVAGVTSEDAILPPLEAGDAVGLLDVEPRQHWTSPPPRYTEAGLVKALESEGIGRPSTYAAIIDTIQSRGYVEQDERKFYPTALGELVTDKLVNHFPRVVDVKFTSHMEDELDKIEEAHLDWVSVLNEFYEPFREQLKKATDEMEATRSQPSEYECPDCGAPMVYRWSKAGRFLACTNYPECKGTLNVDRQGRPIIPEKTEHQCEECGRPMLLRQSRSGTFLGCSGYPECRNTIACDERGEPLRLVKEEELKRPCDACGEGTMVVKRKGRRAFLGCNRFPECKNTAPLPGDVRLEKKPVPPPEEAGLLCDKCGRPMVIRSGRRGKFVACSGYPKCRNTKPAEKLDELKAAQERGELPPGGPGKAAAKPAAPAQAARRPVENENGDAEAHPKFGVPPAGFAWTRTGRPVVEDMPEPGTLACPECGSTMELKRGRFGPFFSCTNFPKCKFNANLRGAAKKQAEIDMPAPPKPKAIPTDIPCDECGQPMVVRQGRRGKFLGCSNYPECKGTKELPPGFDLEKAEAAAARES